MPEHELTLIANNQEYIKSLMDASAANNKFFGDFSKQAKQNEELWNGMAEGIEQELKSMGISADQFFAKFKQGANAQKGILEDLENELRQYKEAKQKATTTQDIEKYNRKIAETNAQITKLNNQTGRSDSGFKKLNDSAKKSSFSIDSLRSSFFKVLGIVGTVTGSMAAFTAIMKKSEQGAEFYERKIAGLKAGFSVLTGELTSLSDEFITNKEGATKWGGTMTGVIRWLTGAANLIPAFNRKMKDLTGRINDAAAAAEAYTKVLQDIEDQERAMIVPRAETNKKIAEAKLLYEDETKSIQTRIGALEKVLSLEQQTVNDEIELQKKVVAQIEVANAEKMKAMKLNQVSDEDDMRLQQAKAKLIDLETTSLIKQRKLQSTLSNARKELEKKNNEEILKNREEFLKQIEELTQRYTDAQIESKTGKERIDAEEKFGLEEINMLQANLLVLGNITKEQYAMIEGLRTAIKRKATLERIKLDNEERLQVAANKRGLMDTLLKNAEDEIDLTDLTEEQKLEAKIKAYEKTLELLRQMSDNESQIMAQGLEKSIKFMKKDLNDLKSDKEFSIWKALGINEDTKEGKAQIKGIETFTNSVLGSVSTIMDAEAELAAKRRQQAEERISDLENQLSEEMDLQNKGLANNVNNVKKELEEAKKSKEAAIEQEKKIQKAQMALDTVSQISSLITASAAIFKATAKIPPPLGQILAIAAIGTMFGFMAVAKIKAAQAAKMEEGGYIDEYGVIHGKRHSQGGEKLNKHVEVEEGEGVGVFNRSATKYYGNYLPKWVRTINNKEFPKFDIKNTPIVNNNVKLETKELISNLKDIRSGIDTLNANMSNTKSTNYGSNVRVEKDRNRTRIIHTK